jgi:hypothetical protein
VILGGHDPGMEYQPEQVGDLRMISGQVDLPGGINVSQSTSDEMTNMVIVYPAELDHADVERTVKDGGIELDGWTETDRHTEDGRTYVSYEPSVYTCWSLSVELQPCHSPAHEDRLCRLFENQALALYGPESAVDGLSLQSHRNPCGYGRSRPSTHVGGLHARIPGLVERSESVSNKIESLDPHKETGQGVSGAQNRSQRVLAPSAG